MKGKILILFIFISLSCNAQKTWYGEIALYGGGGANDIFRYKELIGAASFDGNSFYSGGVRARRMVGEWFSVESGLGYSFQKYTMHTAPLPEVTTTTGSFGYLTVPLNARADFLRYFFADAGIVAGVQLGDPDTDDISGLGLAAGAGAYYRFRSDVIITLRAFTAQYGVLHFYQGDNAHTLSNKGITLSVGYRFIRLGKCHCPEGDAPGRKFF